MSTKTDSPLLLFPPGIEKRNGRSKLLEEAGNFYKKLFIIYAKHVKSDIQTDDSIEQLQKKASDFLMLIKRSSVNDKTGIFSKPILSITTDTTEIVDKVDLDPLTRYASITDKSNTDKDEDSDDKIQTFSVDNEYSASNTSKSTDLNENVSCETSINYYVNSAKNDNDESNEIADDKTSVSTIEYNFGGYNLGMMDTFDDITRKFSDDEDKVSEIDALLLEKNHDEHDHMDDIKDDYSKTYDSFVTKSVETIIENDKSNELNLTTELANDIYVMKSENIKFDTFSSVNSSDSFHQIQKEHFDKSSQTIVLSDIIPVTNNSSLNIINYNIYWDSTEIFNINLPSIQYCNVFTLLIACISSFCSALGLIFLYNNQLTAIIPLITLFIYGIAFTIIPKFNLNKLIKIVNDWKEQLNLGEISKQLPSADWIENYARDSLQIMYFRWLKWMGSLLIIISGMGLFNINFFNWPWNAMEWIYIISLLLVHLLFTVTPILSSIKLSYFGKYFALKSLLMLYNLQSIGLCSLSLFGESSPFLIKNAKILSYDSDRQVNIGEFNHFSLAIVINRRNFCLFKEDQCVMIFPHAAYYRHSDTLVYFTGKILRSKSTIYYIFNGGRFNIISNCHNFLKLFLKKFTIALEFDTKFLLDTFLEKLHISPISVNLSNINLTNNYGLDQV